MTQEQKHETHVSGNVEKLTQIGKVEGDVTIQTTSTFIQQPNAKKKKWRNLERYLQFVTSDRPELRAALATELAICLHQAFSQTGYMRFNGIVRLTDMLLEGDTYRFYELLCHQIEFCSIANQREGVRMETVQAIRERGVDSLGRNKEQARASEVQEVETFEKEWNIVSNLAMSTRFLAVEFIYDPPAKRITVDTVRNLTCNPDDYPNRVTTTSEVLCYIASMANGRIGVFDDVFDPDKENYRLLKLAFAAHEGNLDLGNLLINAGDYEEWDYINTDFDNKYGKSFQKRGTADAQKLSELKTD